MHVTVEDLEFKGETDLAIFVLDPDGSKVTLPKSEIEYDQGAESGDVISVEMPEWLAIERGLV